MTAATASGLSFSLPVTKWSVWPPQEQVGAAPDVKFVDALLRRRLSPLAKMVLHVAHACAQELPRLRLVFASRHGDLNRTMGMLRDMAREEALSPTAFSLSVHNASAGVFSLFRRDTSPSTAVAAGEETLGFALLESWCQWRAEPGQPVLMVYGDEPLPAEYAAFSASGEKAQAIAVLLSREGGQRIECGVTAGANADGGAAGRGAEAVPQSAAFLECLRDGAPADWGGARRSWSWR